MTRFRWFHLENGEVPTNLVKNRVGCYYILGVIPRVFRNREKECLDNDDFVILGKNVILNRVSCYGLRDLIYLM